MNLYQKLILKREQISLSFLYFALFISACNNVNDKNSEVEIVKTDSILEFTNINIIKENNSDTTLQEFFSDSTHIGYKGKCKIEIKKSSIGESYECLFEIKFYVKNNNKWVLKNIYQYQNYSLLDMEPQFLKFNDDYFKDLIFTSGSAVRGANNVNQLLIYVPKSQELKLIDNSLDYPNLAYNKKLNCINSYIFTGSFTSSFLKLENYKLVEFARVETIEDERTVYEIDKNGNEKIILKDKINPANDAYYYYTNYKPLE